MDQNFTDDLYSALESRLAELQGFTDHYAASLAEVNRVMGLLRKRVHEQGFMDENAEIDFFKHIKPGFYSLFIELIEKHNLNSGEPVGPLSETRSYYVNELLFIRRFFEQHAFRYQYFLLEEDCKDEEFFLRKNFNNINGLYPIMPDDSFCTQQDYIFAKFIALGKLQVHVSERINNLDLLSRAVLAEESPKVSDLIWTGEKIDLVELAYGLYFMGSLNNGKVDLADIVSWLEKSLSVDLGYVYRKFLDISRRKTLSYTRFLDEMREWISRHILERKGIRKKSKTSV